MAKAIIEAGNCGYVTEVEAKQKGHEHCIHSSCPVPVGIIKTVEVAAGTALPGVAKIEVMGE